MLLEAFSASERLVVGLPGDDGPRRSTTRSASAAASISGLGFPGGSRAHARGDGGTRARRACFADGSDMPMHVRGAKTAVSSVVSVSIAGGLPFEPANSATGSHWGRRSRLHQRIGVGAAMIIAVEHCTLERVELRIGPRTARVGRWRTGSVSCSRARSGPSIGTGTDRCRTPLIYARACVAPFGVSAPSAAERGPGVVDHAGRPAWPARAP